MVGRLGNDEQPPALRSHRSGRRFGDTGGAGDKAHPVDKTIFHAANTASMSARRSAASALLNALPIPTAAAPASRKARAFDASTPPVGISWMSGSGPRSSRTRDVPAADAGNNLTNVAPASQPACSSVGEKPPGMKGRA